MKTLGAVLSRFSVLRRRNASIPPKSFLNRGFRRGFLNFPGRRSIIWRILARWPASGCHFPPLLSANDYREWTLWKIFHSVEDGDSILRRVLCGPFATRRLTDDPDASMGSREAYLVQSLIITESYIPVNTKNLQLDWGWERYDIFHR